MKEVYTIRLTVAQQKKLKKALRGGKISALEIRRMQIVLMADKNGPGLSTEKIAEALFCSGQTVINVRRKFFERGFSNFIERKKQEKPSRSPILDGHGEARLIALACGNPPEGSATWTLRLLAKQAVELEFVDEISYETVRRVLKKRIKTSSKAPVVHST